MKKLLCIIGIIAIVAAAAAVLLRYFQAPVCMTEDFTSEDY